MKVERVEIKDVRLPVQLQRAMAIEAECCREVSRFLFVQIGTSGLNNFHFLGAGQSDRRRR